MLSKINPIVPRHWLYCIVGIVWTGVGAMLCLRAIGWFGLLPLNQELLFEFAGLLSAVACYAFVFSKVVRKNIERIAVLPAHVSAFAFTAVKGYIMIAAMISIGLLLRNSSIPKHYLSIPYTAMGMMLLFGSIRFYTEFFSLILQKNKG